MKRKTAQQHHAEKPLWPAGKPIPSFRSPADEDRFWRSYEFEDDLRDEGWEEIEGPQPPRPPQPRR